MSKTEGKFCRKPFEHFEVDAWGRVRLCCPTWLPTVAGVLDKTSTVEEVFNSPAAQLVRQSIHDGSFKYCNKDLCPHIQNGSLPSKEEVEGKRIIDIVKHQKVDGLIPDFYNLCYDESCNLSCPSCRKRKINHTEGREYDIRKVVQEQIIKDLFEIPHTRNCTVSITGSGDPFGSKLFRELLFNIDGKNFPKLNINLQTNGVMFTKKYWDKMEKIHGNIKSVIVSFDAGTEETYDIVRKGGDWKQLQENMKMLSKLRELKLIKMLRIDFVVQESNYQEMEAAIKIGKELSVDRVYFSQLVDWGTWANSQYQQYAICNVNHPDHEKLLKILRQELVRDPIVDLGNLSSLI